MPTTYSQEFKNLDIDSLIQHALDNEEGQLCNNNAFAAITGARTGRSPKDRFIVCDDLTRDSVDWGKVNQPITAEKMQLLWDRAQDELSRNKHYVAHLQVGANADYAIPVCVRTEFAWHNIFANHLFIRERNTSPDTPEWQIASVPSLKTTAEQDGVNSDGTVIIDLSGKRVLLLGMRYAGEMKKAMFTVQNFLLPGADSLPMHCSANIGKNNDVALFFGLSGTGKTTLSADPERSLIGDDEHAWSPTGIFNLEGGCYAKCINLSHKTEPLIYDAIRAGTILENVVIDKNGAPDYADSSLTMNSRAAYPRDFIPNCVPENSSGHPNSVIFLTCDLYGVLPPVALLSETQAAYYFLSGYTALVGSTEVGSNTAIQTTFSTCFGAPFFPRPATTYAELLIKRLQETGAQVYLVNTGWTGGAYGDGERFSIPTTRAIIDAILSGDALRANKTTMPGFNFSVPTELPNVDSKCLLPRNTWSDASSYDKQCAKLIKEFQDNFKQYTVPTEIFAAGPEAND